jgi:hypothetical protein
MGAKVAKVSDEVVDVWLRGLPSSTGDTIIVSLLEQKPPRVLANSATTDFEEGSTGLKIGWVVRPWQEWLNQRYGFRYRVGEFPTTDTEDRL